jgi:hypothetical protein
MADVKITVVRKLNYADLFGKDSPAEFTGAPE